MWFSRTTTSGLSPSRGLFGLAVLAVKATQIDFVSVARNHQARWSGIVWVYQWVYNFQKLKIGYPWGYYRVLYIYIHIYTCICMWICKHNFYGCISWGKCLHGSGKPLVTGLEIKKNNLHTVDFPHRCCSFPRVSRKWVSSYNVLLNVLFCLNLWLL